MSFSKEIKTVLLFVVLSVTVFIQAARELPSYIKPCLRHGPNVSKCWGDTLEVMRPHLMHGIPQMGIPPIDPLKIDSLKLALGSGSGSSVSFDAKLTNLTLTGAGNLQLTHVNIRFNESGIPMKLDTDLFFPHIEMKSRYNAIGQVLLLNFNSNGPFIGRFENILASGKWFGRSHYKKGKQHIMFETQEFNVSVGKIFMHFDNLLGNNTELNDHINTVINENIDVLYDDVKPIIQETIYTVLTTSVNKVYDIFPLDELYPEN